MKLFIDPDALKSQYAASPAWLKTLMNAFADGLNYYLSKHPEVKPRVIQHFEPWMALSFTEGSIGGDIETVNLNQLEAFYGKDPAAPGALSGSGRPNRRSRADRTAWRSRLRIPPAHHALLLINPHTSFFFRSELQMVSDEGLNAYGAVTWGQFFIYQGFNERTGWMHTSSGVDAVDEYLETVQKKGDGFFYKYGNEERPVVVVADHRAVPDRQRDGRKEIHRLPHPSRTRHPRGQRQVGQHPPDAGAGQGAEAILHAHQDEGLQVVPADHGTEGELVEQHDLRRRRRRHRLLPRQLHSEARYQFRLDQAGGWQQSGDGVAGTSCGGRDAAPAEPQERLALQHQQLAVVRRRAQQSEEGRLSRVCGERRRIRARAARHPRPGEQEGFHARLADRRGLRQLSHVV